MTQGPPHPYYFDASSIFKLFSSFVMDPTDAFRALGHPHRIAIVRELRRRALACCETERVEDCALDPASCNVGALAEAIPCAPSTLSHHLKELERAGIIERVRDGRQLLCRLDEEALVEVARFLAPGLGPAGSDEAPAGRPAGPGVRHGD
ncbi:MAG: ArsR/SmtB family transcription factor [Gemmatimonadota bacterium]